MPSIQSHHCVYTVSYERVVVRSGPSMDDDIIACKKKGEYVTTDAIMVRDFPALSVYQLILKSTNAKFFLVGLGVSL